MYATGATQAQQLEAVEIPLAPPFDPDVQRQFYASAAKRHKVEEADVAENSPRALELHPGNALPQDRPSPASNAAGELHVQHRLSVGSEEGAAAGYHLMADLLAGHVATRPLQPVTRSKV